MAWNGSGDASGNGFMGTRLDGNLTTEDIAATWANTNVLSGNHPATSSTMTLSAGTRTTAIGTSVAALTGAGRYEIRMINDSSEFISDAGTQIILPEVIIFDGLSKPLIIDLPEDVIFENVRTGVTDYGFALIGAAKGNANQVLRTHTGTIAWNGTGDVSGNGLMGTRSDGAVTREDVIVSWSSNDFSTGNHPATSSTMTLSAGSRRTTQPSTSSNLGILTGRGSYEIRMFDDNFNFIGDPGMLVVPESPTPPAEPAQITLVDFDRTMQNNVTLRWQDTGGNYSIQASNDLTWDSPTTFELNGNETEMDGEIQYQFNDSAANTAATRFWRVVSE